MVLRTTRLTTVGSDVYMRGVVVPADAPGMTAAGRDRLLQLGSLAWSQPHQLTPVARRRAHWSRRSRRDLI
jgi:hypothetical protein